MSKKHSRREKVWLRDGKKCFYCNAPLSLKQATLDHKIARRFGGSDSIENLVCACSFCNGEKGTLTVQQFLTWRESGRSKLQYIEFRKQNPKTFHKKGCLAEPVGKIFVNDPFSHKRKLINVY